MISNKMISISRDKISNSVPLSYGVSFSFLAQTSKKWIDLCLHFLETYSFNQSPAIWILYSTKMVLEKITCYIAYLPRPMASIMLLSYSWLSTLSSGIWRNIRILSILIFNHYLHDSGLQSVLHLPYQIRCFCLHFSQTFQTQLVKNSLIIPMLMTKWGKKKALPLSLCSFPWVVLLLVLSEHWVLGIQWIKALQVILIYSQG